MWVGCCYLIPGNRDLPASVRFSRWQKIRSRSLPSSARLSSAPVLGQVDRPCSSEKMTFCSSNESFRFQAMGRYDGFLSWSGQR